MSDSQSDRFFSMLEHAIVPVRATEFAEVETGLCKHNFQRSPKRLVQDMLHFSGGEIKAVCFNWNTRRIVMSNLSMKFQYCSPIVEKY